MLDATGVMYQPADDVADLLIPFARAKGCATSDAEITPLYRRGIIDSRELWACLGIADDASLLDRQLAAAYTVTYGLPELLRWRADAGIEVACISNDLAVWAAARADHFGLSDALVSWTISATVGVRKPDKAIYDAFLATILKSTRCVFADDRLENVTAAASCVIHGVLFAPRSPTRSADIATVDRLIGVL